MDDRPRQGSPASARVLLPLLFALLLFAGVGGTFADSDLPSSLTAPLASSASMLASGGDLLSAADPFAHTPEDAVCRPVLSSAVKRPYLPAKTSLLPSVANGHGGSGGSASALFLSFLPSLPPPPSGLCAAAFSPVAFHGVRPLPGPRGPAFYAMPPPHNG